MIKKRHFVKKHFSSKSPSDCALKTTSNSNTQKVETLFACLVFSAFMLSSFSSIAQVQPQQHLQQLQYDRYNNDAYSTKE